MKQDVCQRLSYKEHKSFCKTCRGSVMAMHGFQQDRILRSDAK